MSDELLRMKTLLERAGLRFEDGSIDYAELCAYAAAVRLLKSDIENTENTVFLPERGDDDSALYARYADMLKIDRTRYTADELRDEIIRRLSMKFAQLGSDDAKKSFEAVGSGTYSIGKDKTVLSGLKFEDLKEAGKFLLAYAPCSSKKLYSGTGDKISWNMWEKTGYTFNDYDELKLPWEFLDKLRSDIF